MSKSPYLSNPNILAHPDRIVQKVELDMTAQDSYLAGSPISAEGKLANDASAIGILLYDVHKAIGGRTGVVVIFGRIKQDVAAEHSGITISAEAKAALIDITFTGDGCRMGGGGLTELPEGYPYKEKSETVIEWDGNTEGLYCVSDAWYLVSDEVISDDVLRSGTVTFNAENGVTEMPVGPYWDALAQYGLISEDVTGLMEGTVVVVRKPGVSMMGEGPFERTGTYFVKSYGTQVTKFVSETETIHTMAPEFLPAGVGGGVPAVTTSDNGKFLRVVNGAWTAVALKSAEGGSF